LVTTLPGGVLRVVRRGVDLTTNHHAGEAR
jgi:hypothetical protein